MAHISLFEENKEQGSLYETVYPKPRKMLTTSVKIGTSRSIYASIDRGSRLNLISAILTKEQGLQVEPLPKLLAEGISGSEIPIYSSTAAAVEIVDSRGRKETQHMPFVVTDLRRYPIYLDLPWIDASNPKLNYAQRRMYHRGRKAKDEGA